MNKWTAAGHRETMHGVSGLQRNGWGEDSKAQLCILREMVGTRTAFLGHLWTRRPIPEPNSRDILQCLTIVAGCNSSCGFHLNLNMRASSKPQAFATKPYGHIWTEPSQAVLRNSTSEQSSPAPYSPHPSHPTPISAPSSPYPVPH